MKIEGVAAFVKCGVGKYRVFRTQNWLICAFVSQRDGVFCHLTVPLLPSLSYSPLLLVYYVLCSLAAEEEEATFSSGHPEKRLQVDGNIALEHLFLILAFWICPLFVVSFRVHSRATSCPCSCLLTSATSICLFSMSFRLLFASTTVHP